MADQDRIYFAQRAAEEQQLAVSSGDPEVAKTHRRMQRAYLERASVGDRPQHMQEIVGWCGNRADAGRLAPKGFPRTNRFGGF